MNSFLAKKAGLQRELRAEEVSLGVKEIIGLPRTVIEDRFHLQGDEGAVAEYVGDITGKVHGGGFLYANQDSLAIGVIGQLSSLAEHKQRPYELLERFKAHPSVAPLVRGGHAARVLGAPRARGRNRDDAGRLYRDGMMVAGDAAGFCFAAGLYLEGINYAMQSGFAAAETAILAWREKDYTERSLARYEKRLDARHVLPDFKRFASAPEFVNDENVQNVYPGLMTRVLEQAFRVDGHGKKKLLEIGKRAMKEANVSTFRVLRDLYRGGKAFGW